MSNDTTIASALGLDDLRVGRHYIRNSQRERIGSQFLTGVFHLHVRPSFHKSFSVWVVTVQGERFKDSLSPNWNRAAISAREFVSVCDLATNPLDSCLSAVDLLAHKGGVTLDGIGYEFAFWTTSVHGELHFSNPRTVSLNNIASTMYSVARSALSSTSNIELIETVGCWGEYLATTEA